MFAVTDKGILSLLEASGGFQLRLTVFEVFVVVGVDFLQLDVDLSGRAVEDEIGPLWVSLCSEG